ncbi:MAG TPA: hypothetical protein VHU91_05845 [Mycobacteriales bacterium]|nr:hypothetical protein [Mycobacteriales bacterium]
MIQAPAKQQLFWHLLPLAVGLRDNRAPDVSLRRSAMPQWHRPPADPDEAKELEWFFPVEGFTAAPTIAVLHADSLFATVPTGADLPGWRIVDTEAQLYDGVMAGYVDPVLDRYISELSKSGARFSRRGLRASGIGPLVQQAARDFQAAVRVLRETAERDGANSRAFRERAEWAAELGAGATRRATVALENLATGPEDRRLFNLIPVRARTAPEVEGVFVTRTCCGAFGGDRGNTCNNCVMDFPRGAPNPMAKKRLGGLGLELTPTPSGGARDSSRRPH